MEQDLNLHYGHSEGFTCVCYDESGK